MKFEQPWWQERSHVFIGKFYSWMWGVQMYSDYRSDKGTKPIMYTYKSIMLSDSWWTGFFGGSKSMQQNQRNHLVFLPHILLSCQNLLPTLPTMQLNRQQVRQRFGCAMPVALALNLKQTRSSSELAVFRSNRRWLSKHHLRQFIRLCRAPNALCNCFHSPTRVNTFRSVKSNIL